jgi:hypothetical protein
VKILDSALLACLLMAVLTWSVSTGFDIEQKVYYIKQRTKIVGGFIDEPTEQHRNSASVADLETWPVPAPQGHPPLRIICGSHTFNVVYAPHEWMQRTNKFAESDMKSRLIVLDRQRNPIEVREDVLHELMHIALWEAGGEMRQLENDEDRVIKPVAPILRDYLIDNPELTKWLLTTGG